MKKLILSFFVPFFLLSFPAALSAESPVKPSLPAASLLPAERSPELPPQEMNKEIEVLKTGDYSEGIGEKLGRGIENLFMGWIEIPYQINKTGREKGILQGATVGVGKGFAMTAARMGVGVYEILTFYYPQKPIMTLTEEWQW